MFFKRKKLREDENNNLYWQLEVQKRKLDNQKELLKHSVDPSEDVLYRTKVTESIYSFLLREARISHRKKNGLS
jgi:hypothetical protein